MKKLLLLSLIVGITCVASAQRVYFLYLQTDNQAPFYARMGDKIYSSAASGYLIIPRLADSTYRVYLGFPKTAQPETKFALTINQNDRGYLIKNFEDGLGLFDMQNLSIVKAETAPVNNTVYETKTDKFSSILSKAADDPNLLKVPVAKKEEPKPEPKKEETVVAKVEEKKEPVEEKKEPEVKQPEKAEPTTTQPILTSDVKPETKTETKEEPKKEVPATTQPVVSTVEEPKKEEVKEKTTTEAEPLVEYKRSKVVRRTESSTTEGFGVVYHDKMDGNTDTIRILIPPYKGKVEEETLSANLSQIEKRNSNVQDESKKEQIQFLEIEKKEEPKKEEAKKEEPKKDAGVNAACKSDASEKDFMKLRKNMASETNDEKMIEEAKKSFKSKCYTTEQLRYLSTLFLTSAAKYQFFDAAFNYVSDKANFRSLQSEIKDEYYLKRFKALIGE